MTYDRGYALQTKSLLLENTTTAADAVVQLFDALGLRGSPSDYALEERNIVTGGETTQLFSWLGIATMAHHSSYSVHVDTHNHALSYMLFHNNTTLLYWSVPYTCVHLSPCRNTPAQCQ